MYQKGTGIIFIEHWDSQSFVFIQELEFLFYSQNINTYVIYFSRFYIKDITIIILLCLYYLTLGNTPKMGC